MKTGLQDQAEENDLLANKSLTRHYAGLRGLRMFNVSVQISIHVYERKMVQCNTNFKSLALPNKLVKVFSLNIAVIITQKNVHTHTHIIVTFTTCVSCTLKTLYCCDEFTQNQVT